MALNHTHQLALQSHTRQSGVVLFFALIALVIMSLAAVALIRSVDTNTLIAGNLAFKQSAIASADNGLEAAISWLKANSTSLTDDQSSSGYYATTEDDDVKTLVIDHGVVLAEDTSGNIASYVIQRMCRAEGQKDLASSGCLLGGSKSGCSKTILNPTNQSECQPTNQLFRVTVRVTGPKNTVAFTQAYVY